MTNINNNQYRRASSNTLGTAGFIFALLAVLFGWIPFLGWVLWALGLFFSFLGLFKNPRGWAVVGFILSIIDLFVLLFLVTSIAALFSIPFLSGNLNRNDSMVIDSIEEVEPAFLSESQPAGFSVNEEVDLFAVDYIHALRNPDIQIVDSADCNCQESRNKYDSGIYRYSIYLFNKIKCDLNEDGLDDYFVCYEAENCWGGGGADNYLSNAFFIRGSQSGYEVDEQLTTRFKKKFYEYLNLNQNFEDTYDKTISGSKFINGLTYVSIDNKVLDGKLCIITSRCSSSQPCIEGKFYYDISKNTLKVEDVKQVD